jgi:hypothetical protein
MIVLFSPQPITISSKTALYKEMLKERDFLKIVKYCMYCSNMLLLQRKRMELI